MGRIKLYKQPQHFPARSLLSTERFNTYVQDKENVSINYKHKCLKLYNSEDNMLFLKYLTKYFKTNIH